VALRHYTDDVGKEGIEMSGSIDPGRDGHVYLTAEEYESAAEAMQRLALPRLPFGYYEIPEDRLQALSEPSQVEPRHGQPGGGTEQYVTHPIDASDLRWIPL
jgi:hypothetical protein